LNSSKEIESIRGQAIFDVVLSDIVSSTCYSARVYICVCVGVYYLQIEWQDKKWLVTEPDLVVCRAFILRKLVDIVRSCCSRKKNVFTLFFAMRERELVKNPFLLDVTCLFRVLVCLRLAF
jgi:hypothetical protein